MYKNKVFKKEIIHKVQDKKTEKMLICGGLL